MGRMVDFESLIERDFIYLLDFEKHIAAFTAQPCVIPYQHEGKAHTYTPDFHFVRTDRSMAIVECKPEAFVNTEKNQRKFAAGRQWCAERACHFFVVTDKHLKSNHRVKNVKLLTQHARHDISADHRRKITALLAASPTPLTIADLMVNIDPDNPTAAIVPILHLAFHHELFIPLNDAPITSGSPVALFRSQVEVYNDEYAALFDRQAIPLAERHL
jgi:hypothetical protein